MGAVLCLCPDRKDEHGLNGLSLDKPHHRFSNFRRGAGCDGLEMLIATQSGAETRGILSDEEREALRMSSARLMPTSGEYFGDLYGDDTESDEVEYYSRQLYGMSVVRPRRRMNAATAAAFRSKLKEPSMTPKSKFMYLCSKLSVSGEDASCHVDPEASGVTNTDDCMETEPVSDSNAAEDETVNVEDDEDEYFKFVRIIVPPGPCGVVFQTPSDPTMPPTVDRFERMFDGRKGTIENSDLVKRGSVLCSINDLDVTQIPLPDLLRALNLSSHVEREFVFRK